MFTTVKNAFRVKEIRHRIFFTLFVLIVYRLGASITVPGVNAAALQQLSSSGLASILNTFSGGGLENYSLFAMGGFAVHYGPNCRSTATNGHRAEVR